MKKIMIASDIHGSAYYCRQLLERYKEHKIALAQALGTSETEEAIDLLMELVESKDQDILEAACESLKKVGDDHNATELLGILQTIPEENEPLRKKISETIQVLHKRG